MDAADELSLKLTDFANSRDNFHLDQTETISAVHARGHGKENIDLDVKQ